METITITRISQTKRGRFALFCGETFLFSVDDETYFLQGLREGMTLSPEELEELRAKSETRKAIAKALEYVSLRDHAAGELYDKLSKKFDPPSCAAAVAKMQELELLNDRGFAAHRARYLLQKGKSRREVERVLAEKGISRQLTAEVLAEIYDEAEQAGQDPEQQALAKLLQGPYARRLAQGKRDQVCAALYRRGFGGSAVRAALRTYEQEQKESGA